MSVKHIREYLSLFEEDNPFYTKGKPDLNKVGAPKTSGFQSYPMQSPVWEYPEWQKEIWVKHRDKIVYEPYGSRTLGSVDWEETVRKHPELAKIVPQGTVSPNSSSTSTPQGTVSPNSSSTSTPKVEPGKSVPGQIGQNWPTQPTATTPTNSKPAEKPYDTVGSDSDLENSKKLLASLKSDFQYKFNKPLVTNSEERSKEKQQDLYNRWRKGERGIYTPTNPEKYPDSQWFHLNAFDSSNINAKEEEWLKSQGWIRTNKIADPVHWAFIGKPAPRPMTPEKKQWIEQAKKNHPEMDDDLLSDHYDKFIYPGTQGTKPSTKPANKPAGKKENPPAVLPNTSKQENDRKQAEELAKAAEKMRQEVNNKPPAPQPPKSNKDRLKDLREHQLAQRIIESFGYKLEAYDDDAIDLIRQRNIQQGRASDLETGWESERRKLRQQRKEKEAEQAKQQLKTSKPRKRGSAKITVGDEPSTKVSRFDMLDRPIPSTQDIVDKRFTNTDVDSTSIRSEPRAAGPTQTKTSLPKKIAKVGGTALGAAGTAMSIADIYKDIQAEDYTTAALEVASNLAFFLGIPFGVPGFIGATAASFALGSKAEQNRQERIAADTKKLKDAEDLLQKCQLTLNTGQTKDGSKLDNQTKDFLQNCINDTKSTIDKLKGRI